MNDFPKMIELRTRDMRARADNLTYDGQTLVARGETIRAEALRLENDLDKFRGPHVEEVAEAPR